MTAKEKSRQESIQWLQARIRPGDTIHCVLRHVSRSGMSRTIDFYKVDDGDMLYLTGHIATALDLTRTDNGARVGGCGMDMGFHVVHNLSYVLHREGFECIGDASGHRCPSNEHSNGDRDYSPHWHKTGGYSLWHNWI